MVPQKPMVLLVAILLIIKIELSVLLLLNGILLRSIITKMLSILNKMIITTMNTSQNIHTNIILIHLLLCLKGLNIQKTNGVERN